MVYFLGGHIYYFIFRPPPKIVAVVGSTPCISASANRDNLNEVTFHRKFNRKFNRDIEEIFNGKELWGRFSEEYVAGCRYENDTVHYYLCIRIVIHAHAGKIFTRAGGSSEHEATTQIIVIGRQLAILIYYIIVLN